MTAQPSELYELLAKIRYDTTAIQAKVTDAVNLLRDLNIPDVEGMTCPNCTIPVTGPRGLAEHLYQIHDGPIPAHYYDHPDSQ